MAKTFRLAAMLIACAVVATFVLSPEAFAAVGPLPVSGHHGQGLMDLLVQASPALLSLRSQRDDLTTRAAAKIAEVKDDTKPEDAARIEKEHQDLLRELDRVNGEITTLERAAPGAPDAEAAVRAERERIDTITELGRRSGMTDQDIRSAVTGGTTVDTFRQRAFDHMASQADQTRTSGIRGGQDETETRRAALGEALGARLLSAGGQRVEVSDAARGFMDFGIAEFAAESIGHRSSIRSLGQREEVLRRAFHSTSDFPAIFENALNRALQARYQAAAPTYRRIAQQRTFRDFRPHKVVRAGDFPQLQRVGQGGEIKNGTFGDQKEEISVLAYAVQFGITREMIINDDLGAIDQVMGSYGTTVAYFEEITFYAMKNVNSGAGPALKTDNKAVFHTDHGNLAGTASAITVDALGKARAAMRKQTSLDGKTKLNISPRILLVGPDKETEAEIITASVTPQQASSVNPFSGKFEVVASAEIAGNGWELYAEPSLMPVFQWGYLEGYTAPRVRMDQPFGMQGVGMSVEHDFGCGAIDFRGAFRNAGG
jgi:hypothetical protein